MNARFRSPSAADRASATLTGPDDWGTWLSKESPGSPGSACCCSARPAVRVVMPPCPARPHTTELLLCGHHYRASRTALTAAKAIVREMPGTPRDVAAWIEIGQADAASRVG